MHRSCSPVRTHTQLHMSSAIWPWIKEESAGGNSVLHRKRAWFMQCIAVWDGASLAIFVLRLRRCDFPWMSFVCGQLWLFPAQHSFIHVSLHTHIAMLTPVRDGIGVGDVSSPSIAMGCGCVIQSMRYCVFMTFV